MSKFSISSLVFAILLQLAATLDTKSSVFHRFNFSQRVHFEFCSCCLEGQPKWGHVSLAQHWTRGSEAAHCQIKMEDKKVDVKGAKENAGKTVFARSLPYDTTDKQLEDTFSEYGPIKRCFVVRDRGIITILPQCVNWPKIWETFKIWSPTCLMRSTVSRALLFLGSFNLI